MEDDGDEDVVCLDESFFVNRDYELTKFTFGPHDLQFFCLRSASTDYDLTGQLVWPGAVLLNNYLSEDPKILEGLSVIELGSGVGITGLLCSRFCSEVVLTDHNDEVLEILEKNIVLQSSSGNPVSAGLKAEKLEWGNYDQLEQILQKYTGGFDLILGADICFQQSSIPLLFKTVEKLLHSRVGNCRFILAYVSRAKICRQKIFRCNKYPQLSDRWRTSLEFNNTFNFCIMDEMIINEAFKLGMQVKEVPQTRTIISNLEGVIYEITFPQQ